MISFAEYCAEIIYGPNCAPQLLKKLLASLLLLFLGLVNCKSLKYSNGVNVISTVGKTFALTVVIIAGFINLGQSRDFAKIIINFIYEAMIY